MHLSSQEIRVLQELKDAGPLCSWELGQALDIAPFSVRSSLKAMRRFHLVQSGHTVSTAGVWTIAPAGLSELARRQQLRIV